MKIIELMKIAFALVFIMGIAACSKEEELPTVTPDDNGSTWTITVGVFKLENGEYISLEKELVFDSHEECQVWSRTAQGDAHSSESHLHYNTAADVAYNSSDVAFAWTEYGPEIDQTSIENTCAQGVDGVMKVVNDTDYYQDKPNVYLKIINVVEN